MSLASQGALTNDQAPIPCFENFYFALRERLRTHKVFKKDKCFYLNYHKFSIKSYVLDVY